MTNAHKLLIIAAVIVILAAGIMVAAYSKVSAPTVSRHATKPYTIRYLPLGDSYTIGESVAASKRWPNQLAASYKPQGKTLDIIENPSVTGVTSQDLIAAELPLVKKLQPDFVSVLIGVNDYVQGVDSQTFQRNLLYIVTQLQADMAQPKNILLITIPDYAKTPTGARFGNPLEATESINRFNRIIISTAEASGLAYADIFSISQAAANDPSFTAADGLHPSGTQYSAWTAVIKQALTSAGLPL